ncbi:hypothetical protein BOX15_Mlig032542g6 [Macrostomum lignano]|uniref:Uncharacterized protein n=2 Tax=Macrostomum lignano TaxID=282301 RepID=A0A267DT21_9PLAT|nr:hypothetical protein BOX15_Mlig032542g4 [Macrostomum lignano]PAA59325.1 hypothetical protein BOX15_Mlig032542g1 [Macrostomum lignano]PAA76301.1 hypothetical protein BOX15_Mlig032542g6 [Macrostomum lignano]
MTERKVLNKYYPPDYDPSRIPKLPRDKNKSRNNKTFSIRTMAPCNMRCASCGEYIYKARKFNSRMEIAEGETYMGLRIYRFYIRCPGCCSEITWKTDLENGDYTIEHGAKRNFEALRTAEMLERKRLEEEEAEDAKDPMKQLEKRTSQSKREMEMLETLQDVKELNKRNAGSDIVDTVIRDVESRRITEEQQVEDEDARLARELMLSAKRPRLAGPSTSSTSSTSAGPSGSSARSTGPASSIRDLLKGSVRVKPAAAAAAKKN